MKYTKEQLQGMSDFELGYCFNFFTGHYIDIANLYDIVSLAFEYGISVIKDKGEAQYYACVDFDDQYRDFPWSRHNCHNENPLRAIACCLILVLQEKQNDNS